MKELTEGEKLMIKAILIGRRSDAIAEAKKSDQPFTEFFKDYIKRLDLIIAKFDRF